MCRFKLNKALHYIKKIDIFDKKISDVFYMSIDIFTVNKHQ